MGLWRYYPTIKEFSGSTESVSAMGLRDIRYNEDYRSGYDNLLEDFFRPSLREARGYCRAVGYFSSSALEAFGGQLGEFVRNEGDIRLVTSVELSKDDLEAIADGAERRRICAERVERIVDDEFVDGVGDGVIRLARLMQMGRLEIRIAVPRTGTGIYHEKIGLFDDGKDFVAFTGSSNESRHAFENNRECLDVYPSWTDSASRAQRKREHFETLWAGSDEGVELYSFRKQRRRNYSVFAARITRFACSGCRRVIGGAIKTRPFDSSSTPNVVYSRWPRDREDAGCADGPSIADRATADWYSRGLGGRKRSS